MSDQNFRAKGNYLVYLILGLLLTGLGFHWYINGIEINEKYQVPIKDQDDDFTGLEINGLKKDSKVTLDFDSYLYEAFTENISTTVDMKQITSKTIIFTTQSDSTDFDVVIKNFDTIPINIKLTILAVNEFVFTIFVFLGVFVTSFSTLKMIIQGKSEKKWR